MRLNGTPPSYAFYAGWDANVLSTGSSVITLHHPNGDLKKVSQGSVRSYQILADVGRGGGSFIEVLWSSGTTERGSSGAGLYTAQTTPSGTQYVLRGGLWGGTALCTNPTGTDNFSRFDTVYPNVSQYLGTTGSAPTATPTQNYTDLWWDPNQDGWGLNLVQHDSHVVFGVWYTYDGSGKRTWFVFSSGTWTDANTYTATLQSVAGPPQTGGTFDPSLVRRTNVGTATLRFSDRNNGTFSWSVNNQVGTKSITRYAF
jgi:lysyl endopeptidase